MALVLTEALDTRLRGIRDYVKRKWKHHITHPWYTFHDASHSQTVEDMLLRLIPPERRDHLSGEEWFYVMAAAWLHDIGMILDLFGQDEDFRTVRDTHHERSAEFIRRCREDLDFSPHEAFIVAELCRFHRKRSNIAVCNEKANSTRLRLLAAYLRLADALHIDATRISEPMYKLLLAVGMPWESRFHWLKSKWVNSISPDPQSMTIRVSVYDAPETSPKRGLLPRLVTDELKEELDSIRDVLIRERISFFLDIESQIAGASLSQADLIEMEMILSNIELQNLSSATEVAGSIVSTILQLGQAAGDPYSAIRSYKEQVDLIFRARPCHVLIKTVLQRLDDITRIEGLAKEARAERVAELLAWLRAFQNERMSSVATVADNARSLLSDGGSILLFGYSSMVLEALKRLPSEAKDHTHIYVAECRGKTQYSHTNAFAYSDGLSYAIQVSKAGFRMVRIIPDITVASLMSGKRRLIDKVVFGANGIDQSGAFGHTAGHLAIAELARAFGIPVYVLADTSKFGSLQWHGVDLERENDWFSRDQKSMGLMREHGITTLNLREDLLEPEKITLVITEVGAFPPSRIPESVRRRVSGMREEG